MRGAAGWGLAGCVCFGMARRLAWPRGMPAPGSGWLVAPSASMRTHAPSVQVPPALLRQGDGTAARGRLPGARQPHQGLTRRRRGVTWQPSPAACLHQMSPLAGLPPLIPRHRLCSPLSHRWSLTIARDLSPDRLCLLHPLPPSCYILHNPPSPFAHPLTLSRAAAECSCRMPHDAMTPHCSAAPGIPSLQLLGRAPGPTWNALSHTNAVCKGTTKQAGRSDAGLTRRLLALETDGRGLPPGSRLERWPWS